MEAAKRLQLYFISLQREDQPTKAETLRKVPHLCCSQLRWLVYLIGPSFSSLFHFMIQEIAMMEEELRTKNELVEKHERLIQGWRSELKEQLNKINTELERV